ncbi:discoidin domain-containing receptor 2-like isoform X2 [Cylas formicarius]|uniref:discoidin domain-containing receptor 2-like isoform X2 n=1 Tax=Cylas formicarius TaxID=197179 RepID=UPI00295835BF|nr:discoidin domain-containing receptor 2-like isoform X2 [Cylas formicarius]
MATRRRRSVDVVAVLLLVCLPIRLVYRPCRALELESCIAPLGMESGGIKDAAISASSAYDSGSVGPHHARLRNNRQGGAWCPRNMVSRDAREFLEIDLGDVHVVTGVMTQGRYGNGQGQEYAEQYLIDYYRPGLKKWTRWKDRTRKELLSGNTDTFTINEQKLDPPVLSSKLRLLPYSDHVRTACMRVELIGCVWRDGLLSYSMPQGVRRGTDLDLSDRIYDGTEDSGQLSHGLGQLVDGEKGRDNFRLDWTGRGKGYEWVGWRNDTLGSDGSPLEMLFEFDKVRNFSAAHLYTNNLFTRDVQVFSQARAFVSLNGYRFSPEAVHFSYMPDLVMEHARDVTIKLHHRIGRFLKLELYFASRWILISEVSFDSTVATGNFTDSEEEMATVPDSVSREYPLQRDEVKAVAKGTARNVEKSKPKSTGNVDEPNHYIGFVIGILTVIILILVSAIVFIIFRNQRLKNALTTLPVGDDDIKSIENGKIVVENGNKDSVYTETCSPLNTADVPDVIMKRYSLTSAYPERDIEAPPVPPPPEGYYPCKDVYGSLPFGVSSPSSPILRSRSATNSHFMLPRSPGPDAAVDGLEQMKMFPREKLRVVEKIGEGEFGDVNLCEVVGSNAESLGDFNVVVVHTLGSQEYLKEFKREVKTMWRLKDPNVTSLLGISVECQTLCGCIREYAPYGDLCQFLQDHVAETATPLAPTASTLRFVM